MIRGSRAAFGAGEKMDHLSAHRKFYRIFDISIARIIDAEVAKFGLLSMFRP